MDYRKLDLNLLVILDTLFVEQSVNKTAQKLGLSQPNVSFSLQKLRKFFNDPLLVREMNHLCLTSLAERIKEPIRQALDMIDLEVLSDKIFDPKTSQRCFNLSMTDIGEEIYLPTLLKTLRLRAPHTRVTCDTRSSADIERAMADGNIDIALGIFQGFDTSSFYKQKIEEDKFVCIFRKDHPCIKDHLSLDTFLKLEHVIAKSISRSDELFEERLQKLGLSRSVVLQCSHFTSIPSIILGTDYLSITSQRIAEKQSNLFPLRFLPLPFDLPSSQIYQLWHRRVHNDPAIIWMRSLIFEIFKN